MSRECWTHIGGLATREIARIRSKCSPRHRTSFSPHHPHVHRLRVSPPHFRSPQGSSTIENLHDRFFPILSILSAVSIENRFFSAEFSILPIFREFFSSLDPSPRDSSTIERFSLEFSILFAIIFERKSIRSSRNIFNIFFLYRIFDPLDLSILYAIHQQSILRSIFRLSPPSTINI